MTSAKAAPAAVLAFLVFLAAATCPAQHKFPLRSGEWEASTPDPTGKGTPLVMRYCLNDQTWSKGIGQNPTCSISQFNSTAGGASYNVSCDAKTYQMNGKITLTFDGMQHMISKGVLTMTMNGKAATINNQTDLHWKAPACSPNDINIRKIPGQ